MQTAMKTAVKPVECAISEWEKIFPDFTTFQGSCLFVKKLIAVTLSTITFLREIFPPSAFIDKSIQGLKIKLLSDRCGIRSVVKFQNLMRGCFDAVEKKYLEQLCVGICPNPENRNEVIEAYNLKFIYKDDEFSISSGSKKTTFSNDSTVNATFEMMMFIYKVTEILEELPKTAYITIKLLYYDNITPPDYEPSGFEPSSTAKFTFSGKHVNLEMGKIETMNHSYQFILKSSALKTKSDGGNDENPLGLFSQRSSTVQIEEDIENDNVIQVQETMDNGNILEENEPPLSPKIADPRIVCPCKTKSDNVSSIVSCTGCEHRQHKVCYGILSGDEVPTPFYCVNCSLHASDGDHWQDPIYTLQGNEREEFCVMRRATQYCSIFRVVTTDTLEKQLGCAKARVRKIIHKLVSEGFITKRLGSSIYDADVPYIETYGFPKYFPTRKDQQHEDDTQMENVVDASETETGKHESSSLINGLILNKAIQKVAGLRISNPPAITRSQKRKRKSSEQNVSPVVHIDELHSQKRIYLGNQSTASEELFQSQKKSQKMKKRKGY